MCLVVVVVVCVYVGVGGWGGVMCIATLAIRIEVGG